MAPDPSSEVMTAWVGLMRTQQRILKSVEGRLKEAGLPSLVWYDVLLELERIGDAGLRQRDIERHTLLERYNVSRLVDRLQEAGLVDRRPAADDGRGAVVSITAAGRDMRRTMWPVYAGAVADEVSAKLSEAELKTLSGLLRRL
jgi:DNA-binding MarR family transcriptional regulator